MELSGKQFPSPVLSYFSDDYVNDSFKVALDYKQAGIYIILIFHAELTNPDLLALIENDMAELTYHIECPATGFREADLTSDLTHQVRLDSRNLSGKVQVNPLITAKQDLFDFSSSGFNPDYEGLTFNIDKGAILAVAEPFEIMIDKHSEDLDEAESIFSIVPGLEDDDLQMTVDYQSTDKIIIKLPKAAFDGYALLNKDLQLAPVLRSMVIVPALIYVLCSLDHEKTEGDLDEYNEKRWFRELNKMLKDNFKLDMESSEFLNVNKVVLAQQLSEDPLDEALIYLSSDFNDEEGDGEE